MKYILMLTFVTLTLAEDVDLSKRGISKTPTINSLSNNGHQKPEQLSYTNYKQASSVTQSPVYTPQADVQNVQQSHQQQQQQQPQQQQYPQQQHQTFSFLPHQSQLLPVSLVQQPLPVPKYQLVAMKGSTGQMHLALIPQSIILSPQAVLPFPQTVLGQNSANPTNYVTPQPATVHGQSASGPSPPQSAFYHQSSHTPFSFAHNPLLGQPSTTFLYSQPAPQLYPSASGTNLQYSPLQQLVNYYQSNPQAKHQLLYGNSPNFHQSSVTNFHSPLGVSDYEKSASTPTISSFIPPKSENDITLNTNEFLPQADEQFRPILSYGSRASYKS